MFETAVDLRRLSREQVREYLAARASVTVPEAGALLAGLGRGASYRAAADGSLPGCFRVSHSVRVSSEALEAVLFPSTAQHGDGGAS